MIRSGLPIDAVLPQIADAAHDCRPLIVSAGVVVRDSRVMICRRRPEVHNGLKWEFPGGKLEPGESPEAALARELTEGLGAA